MHGAYHHRMPYAFAHPAAAVPLHRLLGRLAVPSALVIGSVAPDLWLLVPFVSRDQSHSMAAIFWFNLPLGLALYGAFHLFLKEPLLALVPAAIATRLAAWTRPSLPRVPWTAVVASIVAGAAAHLAWDAVTHFGFGLSERSAFVVAGHPILVQQLLQHGSTVLGTLLLLCWARRKLALQSASQASVPPLAWRVPIVGGFATVAAVVFAGVTVQAVPPELDPDMLRAALRAAGATAASATGLCVMAYCVLWRAFRSRREKSTACGAATR